MGRDLRFAVRLLAGAPGFTAVTVLVLALGIGVTTAVSGIFRGVLIDTLPYGEPDELIALRGHAENGRRTWVAWREFLAWRERSRTFEDIAAHRQVRVALTTGGLPEMVGKDFDCACARLPAPSPAAEPRLALTPAR